MPVLHMITWMMCATDPPARTSSAYAYAHAGGAGVGTMEYDFLDNVVEVSFA